MEHRKCYNKPEVIFMLHWEPMGDDLNKVMGDLAYGSQGRLYKQIVYFTLIAARWFGPATLGDATSRIRAPVVSCFETRACGNTLMCQTYLCTNTFGLVAGNTNMVELIYSYYFFLR